VAPSRQSRSISSADRPTFNRHTTKHVTFRPVVTIGHLAIEVGRHEPSPARRSLVKVRTCNKATSGSRGASTEFWSDERQSGQRTPRQRVARGGWSRGRDGRGSASWSRLMKWADRCIRPRVDRRGWEGARSHAKDRLPFQAQTCVYCISDPSRVDSLISRTLSVSRNVRSLFRPVHH
jgi:hypothetical protein